MKEVLVIGKNSFLSKAFTFINKKNFFSHKNLKNINFDKYEKLVLLSIPDKYFKTRERNFYFEKKIFEKFKDKEIHYISTSKLYPMKLMCSEKIKKLHIDAPYVYNKYKIENMISKYTKKFFIYRISNAFLKNSYSKNTFFDLLNKNWKRKKIINFDISFKSKKDFISINSLKIIFKKMLKVNKNYGIYNLGSEKPISVKKVIDLYLGKRAFSNANLVKEGAKLRSQTLKISKIQNLLNINKKNIILETQKEMMKNGK